MQNNEVLDQFHRGINSATIINCTFSPNDKYLSVLSKRETLHIFELVDDNNKESMVNKESLSNKLWGAFSNAIMWTDF